MKPKIMRFHVVFPVVLLFTAILGSITACNSKKSETDELTSMLKPADVTKGTDADSAMLAQPTGPLPFYTLRLEQADLKTLVADKEVKKIIVQIVDENTATTLALGLQAYGVDKRGKLITGPVQLTPITTVAPKTWTERVVMGDNDLTLKQIKEILEVTPKKSGLIPPGQIRALQFEPIRVNATGHIAYIVTEYGAVGGAGIGYTNPSPPKPPCDAECDL